MAGDLQAELIGERHADELVQAGHLRLPAEPADLPLGRVVDVAADMLRLALRHGSEHVRGDRIDLARAEERGRIAFGKRENIVRRSPQGRRSAPQPPHQPGLRLQRSDPALDRRLVVVSRIGPVVVSPRLVEVPPPRCVLEVGPVAVEDHAPAPR